jgi:hypothetical protein
VRVGTALVAGVALIAGACAWTLSRAPQIVARSNYGFTHERIAATETPTGACQGEETLPRGTSAIRLALTSAIGPEVTVRVLTGSRLLAAGTRSPGWEGGSVTVPLHPTVSDGSAASGETARSQTPVSVCFVLSRMNGLVEMLGLHTRRGAAVGQEGKRLPGRLRIEYLRPSSESWWSMALATARRFGLGRAASGTWNALLVGALASALIALSCWLVARELR